MKPVLVVGASVGGSTTANTLAEAGIPVVMLERDLSWVKPCGGALPPIAFEEFDIPESLISRKVHNAEIHSPTERVTDIAVKGLEDRPNSYVAMVTREEFDPFLRQRAVENGVELIEGKLTGLDFKPDGVLATYTPKGSNKRETIEVSVVIGADGAYSTTAKLLGLPRLPYCVAIQERIRLPESQMQRWGDSAALYLGQDVSPDLYAWVFPKSDHVAVGCGAGPGKTREMRQFLANLKERVSGDLVGGEVFLEEAHALPIHPRRKMSYDRAMLIGDAAGLVVGTSGEGIYWAMKSGKNAALTLVDVLPDTSEKALSQFEKRWWKEYGTMYRFLRWLQGWGYSNQRQREVFTDMCRNKDVQQLTFESYMFKEMTPVPWLAQMRMTGDIITSQVRHYMPGNITVKQTARSTAHS